MEGLVLAVIGDVVASRKIAARAEFDARLRAALERLNDGRAGLLSPYTVTIGDEIQAVFARAGGVFHDALEVLAAIHPQGMRFAFGLGALSTPLNRERAIGMDGPAFHLARAGIERLKRSGERFTVAGEGLNAPGLARAGLALASAHMRRWNATRLGALCGLGRGEAVKDTAARLGVSEQAIYKTIEAGDLEAVARLFGEVEALLDEGLGRAE